VYAVGIWCACAAQKELQPPQHVALRDLSRFFGLQTASTNDDVEVDTASDEGSADDDQGFVEPLDFSALLGGQGGGEHAFSRCVNDFVEGKSGIRLLQNL